MPISQFFRGALRPLLALLALSLPLRATDVLSYHDDQQSTGQNLSETSLNPGNVAPSTFMKRWVMHVDGSLYAQPLYQEAVHITAAPYAGVHNTVFAATEHDSLYALDSENGEVLWHRSLLTAGLPGAVSIGTVPAADTECMDLSPEIGITGSPVIDPAGGFLYVAAKSKQVLSGDPSHPRWVYTLFKVSTADGAIAASDIIGATYIDQNGYEFRTSNDPTAAQDPFVPGSGDGAITVNGQSRVYFNALRHMNRPGLLLYNGSVYIAFASHGDNGPYHGWFLSFDAGTLALNGVFNTTPNGGDGGIWQSGGIPTVDGSGNLYFVTGNGSFDGDSDGMGGVTGLDGNGLPDMGDYGDCFMKLALDPTTSPGNQNLNGWGFKVLDYFSPMDNQTLSQNDADFGSGGDMILPDSAGSAAHPHLGVCAGKEGKIYLVDLDDMGEFSPYTDNVVQSQANAIGASFSTPSYFNGNFYWAGSPDNLKMFSVSNAAFSTSPVSASIDGYNFPGPSATISASGTTNGLVWIISRNPDQLRAYDAQDLTREYWNSDMAANSRDKLGTVVKFSTPTVADGMVFVGASNAVFAYGGPPPPTAPPAAPSDLRAFAISATDVELNWVDHANNATGYQVEDSTDGITYNPAATLGARLGSADITGLNASSFYYFRVRAYNAYRGLAYSAYSNAAGVATTPEPDNVDFSGGFAGSMPQLNYEGNASLVSGSVAQLTDGGGSESGAIWVQQLHDIERFDTEFTFQITPDGAGFADGLTFCIQDISPTATGASGGGLGYAGIRKSIAIKFDVYPDVSTTGLYTDGAQSNNAAPPAIDAGPSGINFQSGDIFDVRLTYIYGVLTETLTDTVTNAVFTHQYKISIPNHLAGDQGYIGFTGGTGGETSIQQILSWAFVTLPNNVPPAPSRLKAAPASSSQINLTWKDNAANETGFLVERRTSGSSAWSVMGVLPANTVTYSDTALTANTRYSYIVRAVNAAGQSAASNHAEATTPAVPAAPADFEATAITLGEVDLQWTNAGQDARNFIVSRQEAGSGRHTVLATLPADARSYADKTASAGAHYTYRLQASNMAGPSRSSAVEVTMPGR